MKKLLHERLREWAPDGYKEFTGDELLELSDEIERYYIPRPRFEDGEPVQFGDIAQVRDNIGDVIKMTFDDKGCEKVIIGFDDDSSDTHYRVYDGEAIKRPHPKVLDADGVEIKVGDEVWNIESGRRYTVGSLPKRGYYQSVEVFYWGDNGIKYTDGFDSDRLSHKEPVLDADGVPIKVGDMVWRIEDGLQMSVIAVGEEALKQSCEVLTEIDGKQPYHYNGSELTHKEPDSLEKLLEYLKDKYNLASFELDGVRDRLSALIERGA